MSGLDISQYTTVGKTIEQSLDSALRQTFAATVVEEPVVFNLPIDHWSPSSLDMLHRCPYQWQQRYLHGRKQRPAEAPVMGTAIHAAVERNFEQKIASHADLPLAELLEWFSDEGFIRTVVDAQIRADEEVSWDTSPEQTRDRGRAILAGYQQSVAPRIQPTATETAISVDMGLSVPVIGRFDVERDVSVIDLKSGKRKQTKPKESWRIQASVYSEARGNKPVEFHSVSATSATGAVAIVTPLESEALLVQPSLSERHEMRRRIRALEAEACLYMTMFGRDEDWPTHGKLHPWACQYCGFFSSCPAWKEN